MSNAEIPAVEDTDLTREELEEVAAEYDIDTSELDDQQLLREVGIALGEIDEPSDNEVGGDTDGAGDEDGASGNGDGSLRGKVASKLAGAAKKVDPNDGASASEDGDGSHADEAAGEGSEDASEQDSSDQQGSSDQQEDDEQALPGEPVAGPTRDELRDELRSLGLPVSGTKEELQQRLDEAKTGQDDDADVATDTDEDDEGDAGSDGGDEGESDSDEGSGDKRLRDRVAARLDSLADRLRASGDSEDEDDEEDDEAASDEPSKVRKAGRAVKDRVTALGGSAGSKLREGGRTLKEKVSSSGGSDEPSKLRLAGRTVKDKVTPG